MRYRTFRKSGKRVSALGFGTMRLPTTGKEADIDEPAAIEMLRFAIDHGVNYVDTAYVYHGGNSERLVGNALRDGYREKVWLATKCPIWSVEKPGDFDRFLDEQLARLQTERIDFYLLHCLQQKPWSKMRELGALAWGDKARADGRIGQFGFSFHDRYEVFQEIVDAYDWSLCQIQYNYVSEEVQAGTKGLHYAAQRGLDVVVMEPLFGGTLAHPPPPVAELWNTAGRGRDPVELALRWVWNQPEVSLVLSGMSTLAQVKQNIEIASRAEAGALGEEEAELIARVRDKYRELSPVPCTKCGYCMPCPNGVDIPVNLELYNHAVVFRGTSLVLCRNLYLSLPESQRAKACVECRTCQQRCPQQIEISTFLSLLPQELAEGG